MAEEKKELLTLLDFPEKYGGKILRKKKKESKSFIYFFLPLFMKFVFFLSLNNIKLAMPNLFQIINHYFLYYSDLSKK